VGGGWLVDGEWVVVEWPASNSNGFSLSAQDIIT